MRRVLTLGTVVYADRASLYHLIEKAAPCTLCGRIPERINSDWFDDPARLPAGDRASAFCRSCLRRARRLMASSN